MWAMMQKFRIRAGSVKVVSAKVGIELLLGTCVAWFAVGAAACPDQFLMPERGVDVDARRYRE
ncbi:hypothetical protein GCM10022238_06880 [Gordonia hankookensis]